MSYGSAENPLLEPFWDGVNSKRLMVQECRQCGNVHFPPTVVCPNCLSQDQVWSDASGRARVESAVTFHQRYWNDRPTPYDVYLVQLEEGPLMMSNSVAGYSTLEVGDKVRVLFDVAEGGRILPQFVRESEYRANNDR